MKVTDEKLKSSEADKIAFFDVDNTIADGYSASSFIEFAYMRGKIEKQYFVDLQETIEKYGKRIITYQEAAQTGLDITSFSLKGKAKDDVEQLVNDFYDTHPVRLKSWYNPVKEYLTQHGFRLVLVSAGPDLLVRRIAAMAGAHEYFATEIEVENGVYTGAVTELLNNKSKAAVVNQSMREGKYSVSLGFGDSLGDVPMLEQVNHAFVVDNDHHTEMIDFARGKGWTVFAKAEEVIAKLSAH